MALTQHFRHSEIGARPPHAGFEVDLELVPGTLPLLSSLRERFGDVYRLATFRETAETYVVSHPDYAQEVLSNRRADYRRCIVGGRMSLVLGNGLLTSEGDEWKAQRKLLQRCFHGEVLAGLMKAAGESNATLIKRWQVAVKSREALELTHEMIEFSLCSNLNTLFSVDAADMLTDIGAPFLQRLTAPKREDTRSNLVFLRQAKRARARIAKLMAARRARLDRPFDLLALFMEARRRASGTAMSDEQILDEIVSVLTAGHETVASALKSVWYCLAKHPAVQETVRKEAACVCKNNSDPAGSLESLQYTKQVIHEAMRIYPPIWVISQKAAVDSRIGAFLVPAGTNVLVSPYLIHRHPDFWPDPEVFDPDRFAPRAIAERHSHSYLPYSRGPRTCIGDALSMREMLLHVATVARVMKLTYLDGAPGNYEAGFALRSKTPINVRLDLAGTPADGL